MKMLYKERLIQDLNDTVTYVTIDPASSASPAVATPRTDKWGFCVNSINAAGEWFIQDLFAEHLTDEMFLEKLWQLDALYKPYLIGVEVAPHLETLVRLEFLKKKRSLNLTWLRPKGRKKELRIQALNGIVKNCYFNTKVLGYVQNLMRRWYTEMEHGDDALDAFAYQIDICSPPTETILNSQREYREQQETKQILEGLPPSQRPEWEAWLKYLDRAKNGTTTAEQFMEMYDYD